MENRRKERKVCRQKDKTNKEEEYTEDSREIKQKKKRKKLTKRHKSGKILITERSHRAERNKHSGTCERT